MLISSIKVLRSRCAVFITMLQSFFIPSWYLRCIIYRMINISSASLLVSWYYAVLYAGWSTFPRHHCSSSDTTLYYMQDDQYFLGHVARQLILCCIICRTINISSASLLCRTINISSASLLVCWYYVVLYAGWSTFPRHHCSSADTMLYYIQDDQHFLGFIACQLILCCIICRTINISSASLLVCWYYVVLHAGRSTFPRPHCSSADNMLYCMQDDKHFLGLIARTSHENSMRANRSFATRVLYNEYREYTNDAFIYTEIFK